jgi:predicted RNase H-like HicB family nuclease
MKRKKPQRKTKRIDPFVATPEFRGTAMRQVVLYPSEDGYWVVECPSLPGCVSQGRTRQQAIANIREAIRGYIRALEEDKIPVPQERFEALLVAV